MAFASGNEEWKKRKVSGRRPRAVEEKYLDILRKTVTPEDWETITRTAIARAKAGDNVARQWLSDWLLGKPVQRIAPTDPTGEHEYSGLSDAQLLARASAIIDARREGDTAEDAEYMGAGGPSEPAAAAR